jgi:hypothetical protein
MFAAIFTDVVNVRRRTTSTAASRDALNNPVYGDPTVFPIVYTGIKVRILFSGKSMIFPATGEIIRPQGIMYYPTNLTILPQDRVVTVSTPGYPANIEYVVTSFVPGFLFNGKVSHFEAQLALPI